MRDDVDLVRIVLPFVLAIIGGWLLHFAWRARPGGPDGWRTTRGRVHNVIIEPGLVLVGRVNVLGRLVRVTYQYTVDARTLQTSGLAGAVLYQASAEQLVKSRWEPGTEITVYYDPQQPDRASLASPTTASAVYCLVAGLGALIASAVVAMGI